MSKKNRRRRTHAGTASRRRIGYLKGLCGQYAAAYRQGWPPIDFHALDWEEADAWIDWIQDRLQSSRSSTGGVSTS